MTDKTPTKATDSQPLTAAEIEKAKHDGALDFIKDGARDAMATDSAIAGDYDAMAEAERFKVSPALNTTFIAELLDLGEDELKRRLKDGKAPDAIPFEIAKGLLALERAGRNRTSYVKLLCDAIGVKSPLQVTSAGPPYTNDTSNVTAL